MRYRQNTGNAPGHPRVPAAEYRFGGNLRGVGSSVLSEAQAVAKGLKLTITDSPALPSALLTPANLLASSPLVIGGSHPAMAWRVFDGNDATSWYSGDVAATTWVGYDFGASPKSVSRWKIMGIGAHWPAAWALESSPDLTTWTVRDSSIGRFNLGWNTQTLAVAPPPARYWRVHWTSSADTDSGNCEIGSLEFWGN